LAEEKRKEGEAKEAKEAEVQKQEGLLYDSPLFPKLWFRQLKHDFREIQVLNYI